jgi:methyltransferase (TIGR00027 family)
MKKNHYSLTAMLCTYFRAYHAMYDEPKIFNDFLAYSMIPDENRTKIEQGLAMSLQKKNPDLAASCPDQATALKLVMKSMTGPPNILSRSRYTEDSLEESVRQGVKQYVILGAGMDTFAFRRTDMLTDLQVFEMDHQATQSFKRHRINELQWKIPEQLQFIPVNFTEEKLERALLQSSYNPQIKTFFSWPGVTMYLTKDEIFEILRSISCIAPAGSTVVFDYLDIDAFDPQKAVPRIKEMFLLAQHAGEPMKTGFAPSILSADLADTGLTVQEDLNPADIQKRYFQERNDGYYAGGHLHFLKAVTK